MRRLLVLAFVILGAACSVNPKPPGPIPTPTPGPTPTPIPPVQGPTHPEQVLQRNGVTLTQPDSNAFDFRGFVSCCGGKAWPLTSKEVLAAAKSQGNMNYQHIRLGPWRTVPGGEEAFKDIGGPYLEVNGKADLTKWNDAYWSYLDQMATYANDNGIHLEADLIDGWGIKHCGWGDIPGYHPWDPANNVQGENHCQPVVDAVQEALLRKEVSVLGRHGGTTWQVSNEGILIPAWKPDWEEKIISIVQNEEAARGYPHKLIATNSGRGVVSADWMEAHTSGEPAPPTQKITGTNEYNPNPALTPEVLVANYCTARGQGTYYWAWMGDPPMTEAAWIQALGGIKAGCGSIPAGCRHPDFNSSGWKTVCAAGQAEGGGDCDITADLQPQHLSQLQVAITKQQAAHPEWWDANCLTGLPPEDTAEHAAIRWARFDQVVGEIAAYMRDLNVCAWQQARVEIHDLRTDGYWGQFHPISTGNGCTTGHPYVGAWKEP